MARIPFSIALAAALACTFTAIANAQQLDPSSAASIVANLRAPAEQPFPDRLKQVLRKADRWYSLLRDNIDVCDGDDQPDGKWIESRASACGLIASELDIWASDPADAIPYSLKACQIGLASGDGKGSFYCDSAGYNSRYNLSVLQKRAIWLDCHTTRCLASLADSLATEDPGAAASYAKEGCEEASPEGNGNSIKQACELAQRLGSMQDLSNGLARAQAQHDAHQEQLDEQNARFERQNAELDQQMANNAAMTNAVTHNGNLVAETANRQTTAVLAAGHAAPPPAVVAPIPAAQPLANNSTVASNNTPPSNSSAASAGTRQNSDQYVPALESSCVSNFWDPKNFGWFSFQNNCNQPIHLGFVAMNGTGAFGGSGGSMDIPMGGSHNIGQSPAEVTAAGGGYYLFVCPAGSIAVSATSANLGATNTSFRCKKW